MTKSRLDIKKIKELKKYHTNQEVYDILNSQWISISLSYIEKIHIDKRIITNTCQKCWKTFYFMRYKKLCLECSWYNESIKKIKKQNKKDNEFKKELKQRMNETIRQTWLKESEVKRLLLKYTHTQIRHHFNINK